VRWLFPLLAGASSPPGALHPPPDSNAGWFLFCVPYVFNTQTAESIAHMHEEDDTRNQSAGSENLRAMINVVIEEPFQGVWRNCFPVYSHFLRV
jgi:hypothetical protein